MASEMRAVIVPEHGGAELLQVQQVSQPSPGPGQVLLQVAASGVNFIDVYQREGIYDVPTPFTLGIECAGTVVALGADVDGVAEGDVLATATGSGTHAEYSVVDAAKAVPVPDGVPADVAAAAMLQGMTAQYLVRSTYPIKADEVAVVHAAAGGVGQLLVQMIKSIGGRVVATVGSAEKVAIAKSVGADDVIRYDEVDDLGAAIRDLVPDGVHVVYDGVGKATFDASLSSLRPRGMMVVFGASSGQVPPVDVPRLQAGGSLFLTRPTLFHYVAERAELLERSGEVLTAIADGSLTIAVGGRYPLEDTAQAYRDLEGRRTTGKLLILP